ncbi:MAG: excinuclease ABC subunit C [Prolixibacteraceae bacterium]|nr:excinuclease ABC subunit C [Prolixibacteraceae bacterium]
MINKRIEYLKKQISVLPKNPGIYQYFDSTGKIIYVGKAKNLKKRVSSYFIGNADDRKTAILVSKIAEIKHMVVDTEQDALLLENSLIKKYQPRYNILLKDSKTYPWIVIKNERFPRVFSTRRVIKDGSSYFGPFPMVYQVKILLDLFKNLYKLRNCNNCLSKENIKSKKFKVCLEYHLKNCKGPCVGLQDEEEYNEYIYGIRNILKGNVFKVILYLKEIMNKYSEEYNFEGANEIKKKIDVLEKFKNKSTVVSSTISNVDVFGFDQKDKVAFVNYLKVINGAIVQTYTMELKSVLEETREELLSYAIVDIRQKIKSESKQLLVPFDPKISLENISFSVPVRGEKKKLIDLSIRNAKFSRLEKEKQMFLNQSESSYIKVLEGMKKDLRLKELPSHIECFDNSNLQGTNPVASCVVFKNTRPAKREYRHFLIKTVIGADDFASMKEVVYRRYKRLIEEEKELPQLIIVDGGKGQLGMGLKALEDLGLRGKITIIGIAKKLEEIYFPGDSFPLYLNKNSQTLKVIQRARDEAHRFGITFHRKKRSDSFITSELEKISGIGKKTIECLFNEFKSLDNLKKSTYDAVASKIGDSKAVKIFDYFKLKR